MNVLPVAVVGARGRLGGFACELIGRSAGFELVGAYDAADPWRERLGRDGALVALEATRAGQGHEHALAMLARGVRPLVATSGVSPEQGEELDRRARELGLGGLVVPNFSLGSVLLQRLAEDLAGHFPDAEILELHHERKHDAPSGTALETARRIARGRAAAGLTARAAHDAGEPSRGRAADGVPVHAVRMPGLYAHQQVLFGAAGETLTLRHDMSGPEAFGPGLLLALRYCANARGIARGLDAVL